MTLISKFRIAILIILLFINCSPIFSQHGHHHGEDTTQTKSDEPVSEHSKHDHTMTMPDMKGGIFLLDVMSKEGSGTSWQPSASPMHMNMFHSGQWMFMAHGSIVPRYTHQGGLRGDDGVGAPNWFMLSSQRKLGMSAQIMFRTMISLDRITEGGDGYPLLFQSGETWEGKKLIDRQHPHDLFSELAMAMSTKFSKESGGYLYLGYPGEPALGPPAFMHRPSAFSNPDAPLSHHWQDATHITFGVVTTGVAYKNFKIEGSVFNGREPDENRYNFDKLQINSYSGRIFFNPSVNFSLQASVGFIKNPEGDSIDVRRRTASVLYSKKFNSESHISSSLIWGQNKDDHTGALNSYILEAEYYIKRNSVYTRLEAVEKTRHELGVEDDEERKENIGAYTLGYKRNIVSFCGLDFNAGLQGTLYSISDDLKTYYGNGLASYQFYLSLTPGGH